MLSTLDQGRIRNPVLSGARHRIVIVGGGAGGLGLAARLGDRLGDGAQCQVVLVDRCASHLWKPLLHEVAAGSTDAHRHQFDYAAQARRHRFEFQQGELSGLDRARRTITVAPLKDEKGMEILPARDIEYDTLVLAIGSVAGFLDVPGAAEHAIAVDSVAQAERFRQRLIGACMRVQGAAAASRRAAVDIVIVGGSVTGVELAAQLRGAAHLSGAYGLHGLDPRRDIRIAIVEAGERILPALPESLAGATAELLERMNVRVLAGEQVIRVEERGVLTSAGRRLPADLCVWAGGIQVPGILGEIGLPVNRRGQVIVTQTLQSIIDPHIFAFGDCASCPWPQQGSPVPPCAQAAQQQAKFLYRALQRRLQGKPLPTFIYRRRGSLSASGGLPLKLRGLPAKLRYLALRWRHSIALHGRIRTAAAVVAERLRSRNARGLKLH